MRRLHALCGLLVSLCVITAANAAPKVESLDLGPEGGCLGCAISPKGGHAAVLAMKGSRYVVLVDGVEGPRIEQLIGIDGNPYLAGDADPMRPIPVVFSDDGAHHAYFAKIGDEYVLYQDGKELTRGKYEPGKLSYGPLTFTAGGKHLYFGELAPDGGYRIVVDGKPGPSSHTQIQAVASSPDGNRIAYTGTARDGHDTPWAFVDGKQVPHFGDDLRYTGKGQLVAVQRGKGNMTLNVDSKNVMIAGNINSQQLWISPGGGLIAVVINPKANSPSVLTVNTKLVPGTEGVNVTNLFFSPDDKHFAAQCTKGNVHYMVIDGKKGQEYQTITPSEAVPTSLGQRGWAAGKAPGEMTKDPNTGQLPGFNAETSKLVYIAGMGPRSFLVTGEDESDGFPGVIMPSATRDLKRVGFIANDSAGGKQTVVVDGKKQVFKGREGRPSPGVDGLIFSPDGSRYAFTVWGALYIDGKEQPGITTSEKYAFSPDGKHILLIGYATADQSLNGLWVDGKLVVTQNDGGNPHRPMFTPDGKHIFWIGNRRATTSTDHDSELLYVDGKATEVKFRSMVATSPGNFEIGADGTLTFIARTEDTLRRYRVTPGTDTDIDAMIAAGKPAPAPK